MEVCNVDKIQGYFYTIGMNNLTTNPLQMQLAPRSRQEIFNIPAVSVVTRLRSP